MTKTQIIGQLIDTVICGNKIEGNDEYQKLLSRVSISDIAFYIENIGYTIYRIRFISLATKVQAYSLNEFGGLEKTVTKTELFDKYIKKSF